MPAPVWDFGLSLYNRMTKYYKYGEIRYRVFLDPSTGLKLRIGIRNHQQVVDIELTEIGFDGIENID